MADSAAAVQDKTKEKKKKKASGSTKEKEARKKSTGDTDVPTDSQKAETIDQKPEEAQMEQSETQPEKTSNGSVKSKKPKDQMAVEDDSKTGSRKASVAEGAASRKASVAGASRKASTVDTISNQEGEKDAEGEGRSPAPEASVPEDDEDIRPPVQPRYVVPPPVTKKDIDFLKDLDETKLQELKEAFELFDYNQDGFIDAKDLKLTYQSLGQLDVPDDDIVNMISEAINPLDFDAFVILLGYKTIEMDPESILVEALSCWDYDNSGMIDEDRIKHDLQTWGDKFSEEEAEMALEDAPVYVTKKGIAMIDYVKFCNTLSGLRKKPKVDLPAGIVP